MVASEQQLPSFEIRETESEHTAEFLDAFRTPLLIGVKHDFCVGARYKAVPLFFQLLAEFEEVIYFAVVGDPKAFVVIRHGLLAKLRIDDRQSAMTDRHTISPQKPDTIRPTVIDGFGHPLNFAVVQWLTLPTNYSRNPTHKSFKLN